MRAIVRDPATWSSHFPEQFGDGLAGRATDTPRTRAALAKGYPWVPTLLFQDGVEHRRHRVALQRAFDGAGIRRLEQQIATIANDLIDGFAAGGSVAFVRDFARPLPITVFAEAFGVAPADRERFARWSRSIVDLGAATDEDESVAVIEQYVEFQHYVVERIRERRDAPGDDLLSSLVSAQGTTDDRALHELLSICTLLLAAGNDTTTAALSALLHRMLADPQLIATLRSDRTRIPAAIEETLRIDAPVQMLQRRANRATEQRGQRIAPGDMAMVIYASANRDPAHWEEPDAFRLDRPDIKDHLAFTHGPHHCAGAVLARAQLRIGTELLLDRFEDIRLDTSRPLEFLPDLMTRSYRELPLLAIASGLDRAVASGVSSPGSSGDPRRSTRGSNTR